jgi:hypothetical protein
MERVKNEEPQMCCGRSRGYGVLWKSVWKAEVWFSPTDSAGNVEEGGKCLMASAGLRGNAAVRGDCSQGEGFLGVTASFFQWDMVAANSMDGWKRSRRWKPANLPESRKAPDLPSCTDRIVVPSR